MNQIATTSRAAFTSISPFWTDWTQARPAQTEERSRMGLLGKDTWILVSFP